MTSKKINKIVLAYSGGLDTSVMLRWIKERYNCEVVCYCADVGQGDELSGLEEKALASGASKLYVEDLRDEFVREYVWTAVKANAIYEGVYLLGTSLARPVIAKRQIEIAQKEGAEAVAHGATGKGNDQVRFELTYYALQPDIQVVAPWREWEFTRIHGPSLRRTFSR
jgi:argininosuccinate synthase